MIRDAFLAAVAIVLGAVAGGVSPSAPQTPSSNASGNSGNLTPSSVLDPAAVVFTGEAGMMLHAVKPGNVADYEHAIRALQDAMSKAADEQTRRVASGWRVFKADEADVKTAMLFVHVMQPAVPGVDYRPSIWLDKLLGGAPVDLLTKYRDAFAAPPTKIGLLDFAEMTMPPPENGSPPAPGNATPPAVKKGG